MDERRDPHLLNRRAFAARARRYLGLSLLVIGGSLGIGVLGYHWIAGLGWVDALLNASMILTGMGPVDPMRTVPSKVFASAYALFSGVAFLSSIGVLVAPWFHRFLHRFHLDDEERASAARNLGGHSH